MAPPWGWDGPRVEPLQWDQLLQQGQDALRSGVGLSQGRDTRLLEDLGSRQIRRFRGEVRITDAGSCCFEILAVNTDDFHHVLKAILHRAEFGAQASDLVDGAIDGHNVKRQIIRLARKGTT